MLPNFIHVGAAKCASSWLWRVYQEHPDVYVPLHLDNVNFFVAGLAETIALYWGSYAHTKLLAVPGVWAACGGVSRRRFGSRTVKIRQPHHVLECE